MFSEKEVNKMLLFIVNLGNEEVKFIKGRTLAYFTNMTIFQMLKRQIKKVKLQKFLLSLQKPNLKHYQPSP